MKYTYALIILCFSCFQAYGQFNYERSYLPNTRGQVVVDIEATSGGYFILSVIRDTAKLDYIYGVNLIEMEIKGGIINSNDYIFSDSLRVRSAGGLEILDNGNILLGASVDTLGYNQLLLNIDRQNSTIEWANRYGVTSKDTIANEPAYPIKSVQTIDQNILHLSTVSDTLIPSLYTSCVDTFGIQKWAKTYDYTSQDGVESTEEWGDMILGMNSTNIGVGQLIADSSSVFITEYDNVGIPTWARKYRFENSAAENLKVSGVEMMPDTSYLISGTVSDSLNNESNHGFVMRVDTLGELIWAKKLIMDNQQDVYITASIAKSDTSILVATKGFATETQGFVASIAEISINGNIVWQNEYKTASGVVEGLYEGSIVNQVSDGGFAYAFTGIDPVVNNTETPYLIKTGASGETRCHEESSSMRMSDLSMNMDTLEWSFDVLAGQDTIVTMTSRYNDYGVPALQVEDIVFCPNVPIDTILDATIESATSYRWGSDANGETTPILNVTEEGQYTVEVVIDSLYCYTLCDTAKVSRQGLPMATISFSNQWCSSRSILLIAGNSEPSSTIQSVLWSNNETSALISVTDIGTYSVTITDNCDETSEASFTITEDQIIQPDDISIVVNNNLECFTPTIILEAVLTDNPGNPDPGFSNIVWSSGQTSMRIIRVTEVGDYSVTLTDDCGYERTATVTVTMDDFQTLVEPNITTNINRYCTDRVYTAILNNSQFYASWVWIADGQALSTDITFVDIANVGSYSIRITDFCGEVMDFPFEISDDITPLPQAISIGAETNFNCFVPSARLTVSAANGSPLSDIIWNPGNINASSILVTEAGEYTVSAIDECGFEVSTSIVVNQLSTPLAEPNLSTADFDAYCDEGSYSVVLNNADLYRSIIWSVGDPNPETGTSINVVAPDTYGVTVTDDCGNTQAGSITVAQSDFPACPCLEYPNVFTPDFNSLTDTLDLNKTFGPYNKCDESLISDYELVIYNRWGNQVFSTTSLSQRWDGRHNEDPSPQEVYLYYARYTTSEEVFELKGDVTLLR